MGDGGCGQFVTFRFCHSSLLTLFPAPAWGCSHGLQSFRINLLQRGLSPGHSSFKAYPPAPPWCHPWAAVWISVPAWSSPQAAGKYLLHRGLSHGQQGNIWSGTWSTSLAFFSDLGVHTIVSHTLFFLTPHCHAAFCPFRNTFSERRHQLR